MIGLEVGVVHNVTSTTTISTSPTDLGLWIWFVVVVETNTVSMVGLITAERIENLVFRVVCTQATHLV